jgi:hypothetical protein
MDWVGLLIRLLSNVEKDFRAVLAELAVLVQRSQPQPVRPELRIMDSQKQAGRGSVLALKDYA